MMNKIYIIMVDPEQSDATGYDGQKFESLQDFRDNFYYHHPDAKGFHYLSLDDFIDQVNDQIIDDLTGTFIFKIYIEQ